MKTYMLTVLATALLIPLYGKATMTEKQLYAASMENDAQFIECVGNIFFAVADFQRVVLEDVKWVPSNPEFQKIHRSEESLKKASVNLSAALANSDNLLIQLSEEKKKKFEVQLGEFKSQVKDLNARLEKIINGIDRLQLPKTEEIHQLLSLAIAGTGFGIDVSKQHAATKTDH